MTFRVGTSKIDTIDGTRSTTEGGVKYDHYMGTSRASFRADSYAGMNSTGVDYEKKLNKNLSLFAAVDQVRGGIVNDTRALV